MRKIAFYLLAALGAIVVIAGAMEFLRETEIVTFSFKAFAPAFVVVLGLWVMACAIECRNNAYQKN
jgi:hypothetical protein